MPEALGDLPRRRLKRVGREGRLVGDEHVDGIAEHHRRRPLAEEAHVQRHQPDCQVTSRFE